MRSFCVVKYCCTEIQNFGSLPKKLASAFLFCTVLCGDFCLGAKKRTFLKHLKLYIFYTQKHSGIKLAGAFLLLFTSVFCLQNSFGILHVQYDLRLTTSHFMKHETSCLIDDIHHHHHNNNNNIYILL